MLFHSKIRNTKTGSIVDFNELRLKHSNKELYQQFVDDLYDVQSCSDILNDYANAAERALLLDDKSLIRALRNHIEFVIACMEGEDYEHFLPVLAYIKHNFTSPDSNEQLLKDAVSGLQNLEAIKKSVDQNVIRLIKLALLIVSITFLILAITLANSYLLIPCVISVGVLFTNVIEHCALYFFGKEVVDDYKPLCGHLQSISDSMLHLEREVLAGLVEEVFPQHSNAFFSIKKPQEELLVLSPSL